MTAEMISKIPLLSNIAAEAVSRYVAENHVYAQHYAKGVTIHNQHDACATLDVVLSGSLVAYTLSENGSAVNMFEFPKNSFIGANLLFGEHTLYPLNIYSVSDCTLLHITQPAVADFLHDHHFVMQYIKSLSLNSQSMNRKITMLSQKTLRDNILDYINHQAMLQKSSIIKLPISKKELADYLGVQRPSLFRELKKLKDENIIQINGASICILKP